MSALPHDSEAPPQGEPLLIPNPFRVGDLVVGPGVRGTVERRRGPYSVDVRQEATGRILITTTLDLESAPPAMPF